MMDDDRYYVGQTAVTDYEMIRNKMVEKIVSEKDSWTISEGNYHNKNNESVFFSSGFSSQQRNRIEEALSSSRTQSSYGYLLSLPVEQVREMMAQELARQRNRETFEARIEESRRLFDESNRRIDGMIEQARREMNERRKNSQREFDQKIAELRRKTDENIEEWKRSASERSSERMGSVRDHFDEVFQDGLSSIQSQFSQTSNYSSGDNRSYSSPSSSINYNSNSSIGNSVEDANKKRYLEDAEWTLKSRSVSEDRLNERLGVIDWRNKINKHSESLKAWNEKFKIQGIIRKLAQEFTCSHCNKKRDDISSPYQIYNHKFCSREHQALWEGKERKSFGKDALPGIMFFLLVIGIIWIVVKWKKKSS